MNEPIESSVRMTMLVEDTTQGRRLLGEHGLAMWIEAGDHRLLLDTGQGTALPHNARQLGVDLSGTQTVVLSHGHYDHVDGLDAVLEAAPGAAVYGHASAFEPKYYIDPSSRTARNAGGRLDLDAVRERCGSVTLIDGPTELPGGFVATGPVPRRTAFEQVTDFYQDAEGAAPDLLPDDQAVYFTTAAGTVLLLGCAHAGLVNTLDYVAELTGSDRFLCVAGGTHLHSASDERLSETLVALERYDVQHIGLAHCTGLPAIIRVWNTFGDRCFACPVGTRLIVAPDGRFHRT